MADNVQFNNSDISTPPSTTVVAADDIAGVKYQRTKLVFGTDGSATDASSTAPLPVTLEFTGSNATALNILGTVTANINSVAGLALDATLTGGTQKTKIVDGTTSTNAVSVSAGGALKVDNSGVTQSVSGTVSATQNGTWIVALNADGTNGSAVPSKGVLIQGSDGTSTRNIITTAVGVLKVDISSTAANATAIKVDGSAVTQPVSGTVSTTQSGAWAVSINSALPTGSNTIGKFYTAFQTTKALTNASCTFSALGDNVLVASTTAQTIRVHKMMLVAGGSVSVIVKDASAGNGLTGAIPLTTNGAMTVDDDNGEPVFVTASGGAFVVNLSASTAITGFLQYTKS